MHYRILAVLLLVAALAACDDPTRFTLQTVVATDTFTLAAPSANRAELPSALDLTLLDGGIGGGRFPERALDTELGWDFAVRVRDGGLSFVPTAVVGIPSDAGISEPNPSLVFENITKLPGNVRFLTDEAVPVRMGSVYFVRTRRFPLPSGGSCQQYAKVAPLAVDTGVGVVRLQATVSRNCLDTRFIEEE